MIVLWAKIYKNYQVWDITDWGSERSSGQIRLDPPDYKPHQNYIICFIFWIILTRRSLISGRVNIP